jgi:hypothetical protein
MKVYDEDGLTMNYNLNLEEMLLEIPAGPEREKAAIALDEFLCIPHIPTEGYEKVPMVSGVGSATKSRRGCDNWRF